MRSRIAALAVSACLAICGCAKGNGIETSGLNDRADGRFEYEEFRTVDTNHGWLFGYVVDSKTGVTYLVFDDNHGTCAVGGITPLLNRDGTPVIDERFK